MIKVVRITGESYDLETGDELPKALVLSNGVRELSIHVDDVVIGEVVKMMTENGKAPQPVEASSDEAPQLPNVDLTAPSPRPVTPKIDLEAELAAASATVESEGFEPGEEYADPGTGAESW